MQVKTKHLIKISVDFSPTPGARYYEDGEDSGQEFFDKCLRSAFEDALNDGEVLEIDLDNTEGYATSFLDEAFSRLVKEFKNVDIKKHIKIISFEEPDWIEEIASYIDDAQ
jgi:translation initiation factor 2 alpha subunit (eIF-2alpha)